MRTRLLVVTAAVTLFSTLTATAASAAPEPTPNRAYWLGYNLFYDAGFRKTNSLTVTTMGGFITVFDDNTSIIPGTGCLRPNTDATVVWCVQPDGIDPNFTTVDISLDDGNDWVQLAGQNYGTLVHGGNGIDVISFTMTTSLGTFAYGDAGNDAMVRSAGSGPVTMVGGPGADIMCSAGGTVSYIDDAQGVTASIGGQANDDGYPGEGDTICDNVKSITGTLYDDLLIAGPGMHVTLNGSDGHDTLIGGAGNDTLFGLWGDDTLVGNGGDDFIYAWTGSDTINGGAGYDVCEHGPTDSYVGCESHPYRADI